MKYLIILLLVFSAGIMSVFAQTTDEPLPNDPAVNPDANACLDGGVMAGKCNMDINGDGVPDPDAVSWAWDCGWYLIRFEHGIYSREEFPSHCRSLLPPKPPEPKGFVCYTNGIISMQVTAPLSTLNNMLMFLSPDCTGPVLQFSGPPTVIFSVIDAPDPAAAATICANLGTSGIPIVNLATDVFFNTPPTWYMCVVM